MTRRTDLSSGDKLQRGYRPLNMGYTPEQKHGYTSNIPISGFPKAPEGGTGQSPVPVASPVANNSTGGNGS